MATQLSPNAYSTNAPNYYIVRNFLAKIKSVLSKLIPSRKTNEESFGAYLAIAENIKQRIQQDRLQAQMSVSNFY